MTSLCFNAYSALRAWYVRTMEADLQQENPSASCTNPGQFYDYILLSVYEHATTTDTQAACDTVEDIDELMVSIGAKYPRAPWTVLQTIPFRCRISPYLNLTAIGSMLQHRPMNCPKFLLNYNDQMTKYIRDLPWEDILVMFKFMHCSARCMRIERVKEKTLGKVAEEISVAFEEYWRILGGDTLDRLGNVVEDDRGECWVLLPDGESDDLVKIEEKRLIHRLNSRSVFLEGLMHTVNNIFRVNMVIGPDSLTLEHEPNNAPPWYMTTTRTNALEPVIALPDDKFDFLGTSLYDTREMGFPPVEPIFFQYITECHDRNAGVHTYPTFSDLNQWSDEYAKLENASWMPLSAGWPSSRIRIWYYWPDVDKKQAYQNVVTIGNIGSFTKLEELARHMATTCQQFLDDVRFTESNIYPTYRQTPSYPRSYRKRDGTVVEIKNDDSIYLAGLSHIPRTNVFRALLMV